MADLLVQAGDQGGVVPGFLVLAVAEDALCKSILPSLNLPGVDLVPGSQFGHRFLLLPTATAVLSLGAGLSLSHLSEIPGPPQWAEAAWGLG